MVKMANFMLCLPHYNFFFKVKIDQKNLWRCHGKVPEETLLVEKAQGRESGNLSSSASSVWPRARVCDSLAFTFLLFPSLFWSLCQQYGACACGGSTSIHPFFPFWVWVTWKAGKALTEQEKPVWGWSRRGLVLGRFNLRCSWTTAQHVLLYVKGVSIPRTQGNGEASAQFQLRRTTSEEVQLLEMLWGA